MYGYVRPHQGELRVREYRQFRAAYCGLCEALRERYGEAARLLVNYDLTFLAIVLFSGRGEMERRRCPVHPARRRECICGDPALAAAADYSVILAWWKMRDSVQDEKAARAMAGRLGAGALRGMYKKAAAARPGFDANARECLRELSALEKEKSPSLDRTADCFARILTYAAQAVEDEGQRRVCRELFYHVGRTVYILDAVDDLKEDISHDRYNPLRFRPGHAGGELSASERQEVRAALNLTQRAAAAALELRAPDVWQPILENIITTGLPEVTERVFAGDWMKRKRGSGEHDLLPEGGERV